MLVGVFRVACLAEEVCDLLYGEQSSLVRVYAIPLSVGYFVATHHAHHRLYDVCVLRGRLCRRVWWTVMVGIAVRSAWLFGFMAGTIP